MSALEPFRKEREKAGFILTPIDAKEARSLEPLLSERIVGALYNPLDGDTNPFRLMVGLNRGAIQLGARVLYHTEVRDIQVEHGSVKGAATKRGTRCRRGAGRPRARRLARSRLPIA